MRNKNLNDAQRMFIHTVMFQEGIVPMEDPAMDVRRALEDLSPEDARKLKRKFRKLWRKQMRKEQSKVPDTRKAHVAQGFVQPATRPTRRQKLARKKSVHAELMKTKVDPLYTQFKELRPDEPDKS